MKAFFPISILCDRNSIREVSPTGKLLFSSLAGNDLTDGSAEILPENWKKAVLEAVRDYTQKGNADFRFTMLIEGKEQTLFGQIESLAEIQTGLFHICVYWESKNSSPSTSTGLSENITSFVRDMLDGLPLPVHITDPQFTYHWTNTSYKTGFLGKGEESQAYNPTLLHHTKDSKEFTLRLNENRKIDLKNANVLLHNDKGDTVGVMYVYSDITLYNDLLRVLQENDSLNIAILNAINEGILIYDTGIHTFISCNQRSSEVLNRSIDEIITSKPSNLMPPLQIEGAPTIKALQELLEEVYTRDLVQTEWSFLSSDQTEIYVELTASILPAPKEHLLVWMIKDITPKKLVEQELKEREKRYRQVFENSYQGLIVFDCDIMRPIDCNQKTLELFGCISKEQFLSQPPSTFTAAKLHNDKAFEDFYAEIASKILTMQKFQYDSIGKRLDGSHFENEVTIVRDFEGDKRHLIFFINDITEKKFAERTLKQSEEFFRSLFEKGPLAIAIDVTQQGRLSRVNDNFCSFVGFNHDELTQLSFSDLIHPDDKGLILPYYTTGNGSLYKTYQIELRYITKYGETVWGITSISDILSPSRQLSYKIVMINDITLRKQSEMALKRSEELLASINRNSTDAIVRTTMEGFVLYANNNFCEFFQIKQEDLLGYNISNVFNNNRERDGWVDKLLKGQKLGNIEYQFKGHRFKSFWGLLRITLSVAEDGYYIVDHIITNISKLKEAQFEIERISKELKQAQQIAGLGYWRFSPKSASFTQFSEEIYDQLGLNKQEGIPTYFDIESLVLPEDRHLFKNMLFNNERWENYKKIEVRIRRQDGSIRFLSQMIEYKIDDRNAPYEIIGTSLDITEQKQSEHRLQEKQTYLTQVINAIPNLIFAKNIRGEFTLVNDALSALVNTPVQDVIGKRDDFFRSDPAELNRIWEEDQYVFQTGENLVKPFDVLKDDTDRKEIYVQTVKTPIRDTEGNIIEVLGVVTDVTPIYEVQEALKENEEKYRTLFSSSADAVIVFNWETYEILEFNQSCIQLFRIIQGADQTIERSLINPIFYPQGIAPLNFIDQLGKKREMTHRLELELVRYDGDVFSAELTVCPFSLKDEVLGMAIIRDASERKKQELALKGSEAIKRAILYALPDLTFRVDPQGYCLDFYPGAQEGEIEALSEEDVVGKNILELLYPAGSEPAQIEPVFRDRLLSGIEEAITSEKTVTKEFGFNQSDKRIFFETRINAINTNELLLVARDITQLKQTQAELAKNVHELDEKNRELHKYIESNLQLENFAYMASHDLREPLITAIMFAKEIQKRYQNELEGLGMKFLNYIISSSEGLISLIEDLLAYSHVETDEQTTTTIELPALVDSIILSLKSLAERKSAKIVVEWLPELLEGDYERIKSLFQNLISNALKFQQPNIPPLVSISAYDKETHWEFKVQDNGIGIPKEQFEKIFLLFKRLHNRTKYEGTGIGLAMCKKIVEQHKGRIWVESEENAGSTFYFTLAKTL